jgi:excisionase family DNA binding protein
MENYLTIKDVSKMTNICPSILYSIIHFNKLPTETIGSRVVVQKKELEKWMKENNVEIKDNSH